MTNLFAYVKFGKILPGFEAPVILKADLKTHADDRDRRLQK